MKMREKKIECEQLLKDGVAGKREREKTQSFTFFSLLLLEFSGDEDFRENRREIEKVCVRVCVCTCERE